MTDAMKTTEEIVAQIQATRENDWMGGQISEYIKFLPFTAAKPYLNDDAKEEDWKFLTPDRDTVVKEIGGYMDFALCKAINHRGLSAGRSLDHFRALTWLLGEDGEIDWENYAQYGSPVLKQIIDKYGVVNEQAKSQVFIDQAEGKVCVACKNGDESGCGQG